MLFHWTTFEEFYKVFKAAATSLETKTSLCVGTFSGIDGQNI